MKSTYPLDLESGDEINSEYSICKTCFTRIVQPMIKGIWYHKESYWSEAKGHEPIPVEPVVLLYIQNRGIRTGKLDLTDTYKKCKTHDRYWNQVLGFPKLVEGWRHNHYYDENYNALCGDTIEIQYRKNFLNKKPDNPEKSLFTCKKCRKKRLDDKTISTQEKKILESIRYGRY